MIGHSRGHGSAAHPLSHSEAEALISARLDAPLTPQQEQRLASHLATCASCRQFADQMYAMSAGIRSLPRLPASPIVSRQVRERIAQPQSIWERIGGLMGGRVGFAPMAATAAMLALVIAGYALFQGNDDNGRLGPTITAGTVVAQNATQTSDASQVTQTSSSAITPGVEMPTETPVNVPNVRASDETPTETPTTAVLAAEAPTSTATETDTPTTVPTETSVPTDTPTETSVPTDTPEPTATRTPKPEPTETPAPTETTVPTEVPTATETATTEPTVTKTATAEPTATNTATAEPTATRTPTKEPTATRTPTEEPTATETREPTETATPEPTETPKPKRPTRTPTAEPTATEEPAQQPTIGPSDNTAPTEAPPPPTEVPTETPVEEPTDSTQIVPVDGTGAAGETPTSEATAETTAIGGPTEEPNGDQTSNTAALLDDTARIAGISSGGAPLGPLRVNSPGTLMVLSSDAGGSDLQVVSMSDGSVVAHLGAGADPIWSPLGIVLLYQSYADGTPSVGLYDGDTGKFEPISDPSKDGAVQDIPAGWSGTSAYYLRETGDQDSTVILYGYDVNSGETTEVWRSTGVALSGGRPIPTGDGFLIATTASWLLVGADGSESNLGPNDFGLTGEGFLSPGANLVAYPAGDQLIVADASSPGIPMAQIPYVNGNGAGFTWSPDGSYLAVSDGYSLQIYDTSGNFLAAATSDNGVTIAAPQWLSDGIYYVETSPTPSLRRLLESKIPGI